MDIEKIEIDLLLEAALRRYGYDFHNYARASLKRRLSHRLHLSDMKRLSEMIPRILHDEEFFNNVLLDLSITVTEMFRDPHVYLKIRREVVPVLKTYPFVRIWHAGCATGEEVYSMAILLKEEGLLERAQIYATDYNNESLKTAAQGIYPPETIRKCTANYVAAGGIFEFSDYYHAQYGSAKMRNYLRDRVTFSHHNLVTDGVFGEMHLIVCRNVLIYFNKTLQERVLSLFANSLCPFGFLCLGTRESLEFSGVRDHFEEVARRQKIYRVKAAVCSGTSGGAVAG